MDKNKLTKQIGIVPLTQAAYLMGISRDTLRRMAKTNAITAHSTKGGRVMFNLNDVKEYKKIRDKRWEEKNKKRNDLIRLFEIIEESDLETANSYKYKRFFEYAIDGLMTVEQAKDGIMKVLEKRNKRLGKGSK